MPRYGESGGEFNAAINAAQKSNSDRELQRRAEEARAAAEERGATVDTGSARARGGVTVATQELSAALSENLSRIASETEAVLANTRAWQQNALARAEAGARAVSTGRVAQAAAPRAAAPTPVFDPGAGTRYDSAIVAQQAAESRYAASRTAYGTARRPTSGVPASDQAELLAQQEEAKRGLQAAKAETKAAERNVQAQQQLAALREESIATQAEINAAQKREADAQLRASVQASVGNIRPYGGLTEITTQHYAAQQAAQTEYVNASNRAALSNTGRTFEAGAGGGGASIIDPAAFRRISYAEQLALPPGAPLAPRPQSGGIPLGPIGSYESASQAIPRINESGGVTSSATAQVQAHEQRLAQLGAQQRSVNQAFHESVAAYADSSQALSRHGALTTEFIQAFARGQVTLREFESQMLSTIGKFSGWAIAAGLVYGAFNAVKDLGKGATETQAGVAQLGRFIPGLGGPAQGGRGQIAYAESSLRDISTQFNVPIKEVVDSMQIMARVFHNVSDAGDATRAVLAAVKLDQIPQAQATQYLTGISQSLNITKGSGVEGVVSSLNALQNTTGARVSQTLPALARAAPAAVAGGLDTPTLEGLVALGVRAGITGPQVGTAILRSIGTFSTRPASEVTFSQYGIRAVPGQYGDLIKQVTSVIDSRSKAGTLTGTDLRDLAQALGGPLLGTRTLLPILAHEATSPGALAAAVETARNPPSYQKDLDAVLSTLSERFKSLGIALQNFGSFLASSGALSPLIAAFDVFGSVLHAFEALVSPLVSILGVFNQLPGVVKDAVGAFVGFKVATAAYNSTFGSTAQGFIGRLPGLASLDTEPRQAIRGTLGRLETYQLPDETSVVDKARRDATRAQAEAQRAVRDAAAFENTPANAAIARSQPSPGIRGPRTLEDGTIVPGDAEFQRRAEYDKQSNQHKDNIADATKRAASAEAEAATAADQLARTTADIKVLKDRQYSTEQKIQYLKDRQFVIETETTDVMELRLTQAREQISGGGGAVGGAAGAAAAAAGRGASATEGIAASAAASSTVAAAAVAAVANAIPLGPIGSTPVGSYNREGGIQPTPAGRGAGSVPLGTYEQQRAGFFGAAPSFAGGIPEYGLPPSQPPPFTAGAVPGFIPTSAAEQAAAAQRPGWAGVREAAYAAGGIVPGAASDRLSGLAYRLQPAAVGEALTGLAYRAQSALEGPGAPIAGLIGSQLVGSAVGNFSPGVGSYISGVGGSAASGALLAQLLNKNPLAGLALGTVAGSFQQGPTAGILSAAGGGLGAGVGAFVGGPPGALVGGSIGTAIGSVAGALLGGSPPSSADQAKAAQDAANYLAHPTLRRLDQQLADAQSAAYDSHHQAIGIGIGPLDSLAQSALPGFLTDSGGGVNAQDRQVQKLELERKRLASGSAAGLLAVQDQNIGDTVTAALTGSGPDATKAQSRAQQFITDTVAKLKAYGGQSAAGQQSAQQLDAAAAAAAGDVGTSPDKAGQILNTVTTARLTDIQARFQYAAATGGPGSASGSAGTAAAERAAFIADTYGKTIADDQLTLSNAQGLLSQALAKGYSAVSKTGQKLVQGVKDAQQRLTQAGDLSAQAQRDAALANQADNATAYQANTAQAAADTGLAVAGVGGNKSQALALQIKAAQATFSRAGASGIDPKQVYIDQQGALAQIKSLRDQQTQQALTELTARQSVATASVPTYDTVGVANQALANATQAYNFIKANAGKGGAFDPSSVQTALAAVLSAKQAAAQAAASFATQMNDIQAQIAQAQAQGNAVLQASIGIGSAARDLQLAGRDPAKIASAQLAGVNAQNALHQATQARITAQAGLSKAQDPNDAVGNAQIDITAAQQALANARGIDEQIAAQTQLNSAENALRTALASRVTAQAGLKASQTTDPLQKLRDQIAGAATNLTTAQGPDAKTAAATNLNNLKQQYEATLISQRQSTIQFQLDMQQITTQQAINQLEGLLNLKGVTTADRQQILTKIRALQQADNAGGAFDLSPSGGGNIKLPTVYDVRTAVKQAQERAHAAQTAAESAVSRGRDAGEGLPNAAGHQSAHAVQSFASSHIGTLDARTYISLTIGKGGDPKGVIEAIETATGSRIKARLRAGGHA